MIFLQEKTDISATFATMKFYQNFSNRIPKESVQFFYKMRFSITYLIGTLFAICSYKNFFINYDFFYYWNGLSKSRRILGYKKFEPIPLEVEFENFAPNFKLCGLLPYAWALYCYSHPRCTTF